MATVTGINFNAPAGSQMPSGFYLIVADNKNENCTPLTKKEISLLTTRHFIDAYFCPGCDSTNICTHFNNYVTSGLDATMNVIHYCGHHLFLIGPQIPDDHDEL